MLETFDFKLADLIIDTEQKHPDSVLIILGDIIKANLSRELPKYRQHITCSTRDSNMLDHCYRAIKDAYHSVPRAALGLSVLPLPAEEVKPTTGAADTVILCHHWICPLHVNNCLVHLSYQIWPQKTTEGSPELLSKSLVQPSPLSKNCTYPNWEKGLAKSLLIPHIQHTPSLNCYCLVDATEFWVPELPEQPDTETVSFPKHSISWTLDIKRGTHNTIIQVFIHHTFLFF